MLFYSLEVLSRIECYWVVREIFIKCGAEGCGNPSPFHIKPKAHAEEEEMSEDEQRRSKLLGDIGCPRRIEVTEGESGTLLRTASPGIPNKKTNKIDQL